MEKNSLCMNSLLHCHSSSTMSGIQAQAPERQLLSEWTLMSKAGNDLLAAEHITSFVQGLYLSEKRLARLHMAIAEAVRNAIEHGNQYRTDKVVTLQLLLSPESLVVRISDQGEHMLISAPPELQTKLAKQQASRGWGLYIISHLVDHWQFHNEPHGHMVELFMHCEKANTDSLQKDCIALIKHSYFTESRRNIMQITTRQIDGTNILDLQGKITIGEGDVALRNSMQTAMNDGARIIILNLAKVTTIDSSGIGELVSAYTQATNRGIKLKLINLPPKVSDILHITQLITVFDVYDSETEALAAAR